MTSFTFKRLALASVATIAFVGPAAAVDWDFATANAPTNFQTKLAERFAREVAAATKDDIKITVHAGGQLGFKGPDMLGALRDGLVPIGSLQLAQQSGLSPLLGATSLPFLVSGFDEMKTFRSISKPYYEAEFKKFNQKLLYIVPWPGQNIFSKNEIAKIETFATMKIRTTDGTSSEFFRGLGASPAQIPWGEVVPALATGVIDSVSTSTSSAVDGQFWEFLQVCSVVNWQTNFEGISVNLDAWNDLSADQQDAIEAIVSRLEPEFWDEAKAEDNRNFDTLAKKGMTVTTPDAGIRDAMIGHGKPTWVAFEDKVPASKPMIESYLAAVKK